MRRTCGRNRAFAVATMMLTALNTSPAPPPADSQPISTTARPAQDWGDPETMDRQAVIERTMKPFTGVHHPGVDASTLTGKVMSGYQGWFAAEGDGAGRAWTHWASRNKFEPGSCKIDLWPD